MKKRKRSLLIAAVLLTAAILALVLAGCVGSNAQLEPTSISWIAQPKTLYFVGEEFDPADAAISITYNNESSRVAVRNLKDMTPGEYSLENFATDTRGFDREVTLKYGELQLTFRIDVITAEDLKTVTFYPENGQLTEEGEKYSFSEQVVVGKSVAKPVDPVKEGLYLQDWATADGTAYSFNAAVGADLELHARWFAEYKFYNDGKPVRTIRVTEGSALAESDVPSIAKREGYTVEWRYNDTEYGLADLNPLELENLPLAREFYASADRSRRFDAVYIPQTHTVTVDIMGGQITNDEFYGADKNKLSIPFGYTLKDGMSLFDQNYRVLEDVTKEDVFPTGYRFAGWYTKDENGAFDERIDVASTAIGGDMTIYARWQYGVLFYRAEVRTETIEGQSVRIVRNSYGLPESVYVDEGKAVAEAEIPTREASEFYGYNRWWSAGDPAEQPDGIDDFKTQATTETIVSTVGRPSAQPAFYESFYKIRYTVRFHLGDGAATSGIALNVSGLQFGQFLTPSQVPSASGIYYDKDGVTLDFYDWYLDAERNTAFDPLKKGIDEIDSVTSVEGGVTVGRLDVYADYAANINWEDSEPTGAYSGSLDKAKARLSRDNVIKSDFPQLKVFANYDRDWYVDGDVSKRAFDDNGRLITLSNGSLAARNTPKEYSIEFTALNADGSPSEAEIGGLKVNTDESMRLPEAFSYWDDAEERQMPGYRFSDSTGVLWEIEGYYKDAGFAERYTFESRMIAGEATWVSVETFNRDTTVYVRFARVATEGIGYVSYSGGNDYYVQSAQGLENLAEIVVAETHRGAAVVGIDIGAFENFENLERIYTPATLKEIRDGAFLNCKKLLTLPETAADAKLGSKVYHGTAWYKAEWEKDYAKEGGYILIGSIDRNDTLFYEYKRSVIETFRIPDGVEIVGTNAFNEENGDYLQGVVLPASVRIIREQAFSRVNGNRAQSKFYSIVAEGANIERIEPGAFYRLDNLRTVAFEGGKYRSFDNVLYELDGGVKNALVLYPAAREAAVFTDADGSEKTYYIVEESVASIRENAFYSSTLDVLVFRRGRDAAISATTLPASFANEFNLSTLFYVPFDLREGVPFVKSYYEDWIATLGSTRVLPDAFKVSFASPEAEAFGDEKGWNSDGIYFGFADPIVFENPENPAAISVFMPENAKTLNLKGIYRTYEESKFANAVENGTKVFFDLKLYEAWTATLTFTARGEELAFLTVPLGAVLDEEQLLSVRIPKAEGKNSEWVYDTDDGAAIGYGDLSGVRVRFGGAYRVEDTDVFYRVTLKDPYFTDAGYAAFDLRYGGTIPAQSEYAPVRENLEFGGWYFGTETDHAFVKMLILGDTGTAFTEANVKNYAGTPGEDLKIPVYLWARWYVSVEFYSTAIDTNGTEVPAKQPGSTVKIDYGSDLSAELRGEPAVYDGYSGSWASYDETTKKFSDYTEDDFKNITNGFSVYAHYVKKTVTITFRAEESADVVLTEVGYGEAVSKYEYPANPIAPSGKMFDEWYYDDATFANRFEPTRPVYENILVYARFVSVVDEGGLYVLGEENAAGLAFEPVSDGEVEGIIQFRLVSARGFAGDILYLPSDITGTRSNGGYGKLGTLVEIQSGAFDGNQNLRHIVVSDSVANIAVGAFGNLPELRKISVTAGNRSYRSVDGVFYKETAPKSVMKYPSAKEGGVYTLPEGYGIGQYAFETPRYLNRLVITGAKPILAEGAFSGIEWANFNVYVPTKDLNSYCNTAAQTYDRDWLREISETYIDRVFRGSTVTVTFRNTLTGEDFAKIENIELYGKVSDPGVIADPAGYKFDGWCVDPEGTTKFVFTRELDDSLTLYARFVRDRTTGLLFTAIEAAGGGIAGYQVSIGTAVDRNIVIPNFYNGYPVIKIAENGFMESSIVSIEIPYSVRTIGAGAFVSVKDLERVTIGDLNGKIPSASFTVTDNVLYNKDRTTLVMYPAAYLGRTAFTAPDTVERIGEYAFYENLGLTTIELPQSVTEIAVSAFAKSKLEKLSLKSANRIALANFNAFADTSNDFKIFVDRALLDDYQADGSGWSSIRSKIYAYTAQIRYFYGEDDPAPIAEREFATFKTVTEPDYSKDGELKVILTAPPEGKSFQHWTVRSTGEKWNFTTNLLTRDVELTARWLDATDTKYFVDKAEGAIGYASLAMSTTAGAEWTVLTIPSVFNGKPVTELYMDGFQNLTRLTTVVLPASLVTIQKGAFKNCVQLLNVSFPESLQTIGEGAFENCANLKTVRLSSNITTISKAAFKDCAALETFDFGAANVSAIGDEAFMDCVSLLSPSFPAGLRTIGASAFEGAIGVTRLALPAKLTTIGDRAFYGMSKLTSVTFLGEDVTKIGVSAFQDCRALSDVGTRSAGMSKEENRLPNKLNTISANMFYGDVQLKSISIPASVLFINDGAFRYCSALAMVDFAEGLRIVGAYAFAGTAISRIELPTTLYQIDDYAFGETQNLVKIYLKGVPSNVGKSVFGNLSFTLSLFAETQEVYDAFDRIYNFASVYKQNFMMRWITMTFEYIGADNRTVTFEIEGESDQHIAEPTIATLPGFAYPTGGDAFGYRAGFWYTVRKNSDQKEYEAVWNFKTDTVREDTKLTMRYIVSPVNPNENSDGLSYQLVSGDRYQVVGVGSLVNKQTIVIPNYYQKKPVVGIASGFMQNHRAKDAVVVIPETVTYIAEDAFRSENIARFVVTNGETNGSFRVDEDALYQIVNDKEVKLLRYPSTLAGDNGEYKIKSPAFTLADQNLKLGYIGLYAFEYNRFTAYAVEEGLPFHAADSALYEGDTLSEVLVSYPNRKPLAATTGKGTFTLPSDVKDIYPSALSLTKESEITRFAVDIGNTIYFADEYGVLYRADNDAQKGLLVTLVRMPANFTSADGTEGNYVVGAGLKMGDREVTLTSIAEGAFENVGNITTIVFSPGADESIPELSNVNAFKNCSAYILVDNDRYDDFKLKNNWKDSVLYKRDSYITYETDGAIPSDIASRFAPAEYTGPMNGYVTRVQTITQMRELEYIVNASLRGLLRMPYSEIEGWYYDAAYQEKVVFGTTSSLVRGDRTLYAKWVVDKKASVAPMTTEGEQQEYFSYYPVMENGRTVSYEVAFRMTSGITELREIVIPSYYSEDGTEGNKLPVTGFYDDGAKEEVSNTKYNGFSKLEVLVLPETFENFRNIFRVKGDNIQAPRKLGSLVILGKSRVLNLTGSKANNDDLAAFVALIKDAQLRYYFTDYKTFESYKRDTNWGVSAGARGKLLTTVLDIRIEDPTNPGTVVYNPFLRLQTGVGTMKEYDEYDNLIGSFDGYAFDRWEMLDDGNWVTIDPAETKFISNAAPSMSEAADRVVIRAVYREATDPSETV